MLPPNLKRLRTSAVDKLKQSGAPGEDLSTFIPTPTWGSPRVSELQPAPVGSSKAGSSKKPSMGLAARAAHAASLLAQAAANSAARSGAAATALPGCDGTQGQPDPTSAAAAAASHAAVMMSHEAGLQPGEHCAAAEAAAAAAPEGGGRTSHNSLERRPSGQLSSMLQRQRSNDELVSQKGGRKRERV